MSRHRYATLSAYRYQGSQPATEQAAAYEDVGGAVGTALGSTKAGGVAGAAVGTAIVLVLLSGRTTTADDLWSAAVLICSSLLGGGLASYISQGEVGGD
jgi:hypothetical protein